MDILLDRAPDKGFSLAARAGFQRPPEDESQKFSFDSNLLVGDYIEDRTYLITENTRTNLVDRLTEVSDRETHVTTNEIDILDTDNLFSEFNTLFDDTEIYKDKKQQDPVEKEEALALFLSEFKGLLDESDCSDDDQENFDSKSVDKDNFLFQKDVDALSNTDNTNSDKTESYIIKENKTESVSNRSTACKPTNQTKNIDYHGLFSSEEESDDDLGFGLFSDHEDTTVIEKDSTANSRTKPYNDNPSQKKCSNEHEKSLGAKCINHSSEETAEEIASQWSPISQCDDSLSDIQIESYFLPLPETTMASKQFDKRSDSEIDWCVICMDSFNKPRILHKCSHQFCEDCIAAYFKVRPQCPVCFVAYGVIKGNQPSDGKMSHSVNSRLKLPGYEKYKTIVVYYEFPDGIQTEEHPNPGVQYWGTSRTAYLPDNDEGRKVLKLLKEAFNRRLVFTVGRSRTTGADNQVTWNDIHHKTCTSGGQQGFGYPDPTYLTRVQEELAAFGVTEDSI